MKDKDLIKKYQDFYNEFRKIIKDNEIFPEMTEYNFQEFVSPEDWMGVPSFSSRKDELTNSDKAHISLRIRDGKLIADLYFNATKAIDRFVNILHNISKKEKEEFINLVRNLDERYTTEVRYTEKWANAPAKWETLKVMKCKDLSKENIEDLLEFIEKVKQKRNMNQKDLPRGRIATISIPFARIELNLEDKDEIRKALINLANLARIVHNIPSKSNIKKLEREKVNTREILLKRKKLYDEGLDEEMSDEDYGLICKALE
ncbi:MAG: hypothetical protein WC511_00855 [Candidatus Pacearchaeota archaeon]|jgi:hypothetical protein